MDVQRRGNNAFFYIYRPIKWEAVPKNWEHVPRKYERVPKNCEHVPRKYKHATENFEHVLKHLDMFPKT